MEKQFKIPSQLSANHKHYATVAKLQDKDLANSGPSISSPKLKGNFGPVTILSSTYPKTLAIREEFGSMYKGAP